MSFTVKDLSLIRKYSGIKGLEVEVEIRFGRYHYGEKKFFLSRAEFLRIHSFFQYSKDVVEYNITSRIWGNLREDTIKQVRPSPGKEQKIYIKKDRKEIISNPVYGYDLVISIEQKIRSPSREVIFGDPLVRQKNRLEVKFDDGYILHITRVQQDSKIRYEVEMEITDIKRIKLTSLNELVKNLLKIIAGSDNLYTQVEKYSILKQIGSTIGLPLEKFGNLPYHKFPSLRNLKVEHILSGLKNITEFPLNISLKYDGERMFLYLDKGRAYLFSPPSYINVLNIGNAKNMDLTDRFNSGPLLVEGEYFPEEGVLYLYDILAMKGENIRKTTHHRDRLENLSFLVNLSKTDKLVLPAVRLELKTFYPTSTTHEVYGIIDRILGEESSIPTDGVIFTNDTTGESYKWKPIDKLTVDFLYQDKNLYTLSRVEGKMQMVALPWTKDLIVESSESLYNGEIIEVAFTNKTTEGKRIVQLVRTRTDKPTPNFSSVAEDVWDDVNNPITEGMIRGKEFGLLFRYHNRIKSALFGKFKDLGISSLLDIGVGMGGDLRKYPSSLKKITLLEPNLEFLKELERRLSVSSLLDRTNIINLPAEKMELGDKYQLVVAMLSLSYLFISEQVFENFMYRLINLIQPGGYFVFLTIDGNKVLQLYQFPSIISFIQDRLALEQITFRIPGIKELVNEIIPFAQEVLIDIGTSKTVRSQKEYLTDIDLLSAYLEENGFSKLALEDVPDEPTLNQEERIFNTLFTWGIYRKME